MILKTAFLISLAATSLVLSPTAYSFSCSDGIVQTGDRISDVYSKCGEPDFKEKTYPQTRGDQIVKGAVTVERWVYGPVSGAYYHLRFIEGKLVDIDVRIGR